MVSISESPNSSLLSQIVELRNAWEQNYPKQAQGGLLAISGFEHQFLLTLLKIISLWKESTDTERQDLETAKSILSEAISDITEIEEHITVTQVKRTLSASGLRSALKELWTIFMLALEKTPDLAEHLQFVISGQFEGDENPQQIIQGWGTRSTEYPQQELRVFKERISYEVVPDPRESLLSELTFLARDEDAGTTVSRWLGYLLQLGSGFSPESISILIWKELINDESIDAFRATLSRLFSLSQSRLSSIRETLGNSIVLYRTELRALHSSVLDNKITLLVGPSGSGKSALCKIGIQQDFRQDFDCIFLHASDVASFIDSPDVTANRGLRRFDELLIAQIIQRPILVVVDDISDVDVQSFDTTLTLLQSILHTPTSVDVHFILVAHKDARSYIHEKLSVQFGGEIMYGDVELPQLPIEELTSSEALPNSVTSLISRYHQFGPALNLKFIDSLVRKAQRNSIDSSIFRNDLDLLHWFWIEHIQNGQQLSNSGQVLIKVAQELATRFVPDIPPDFDSSISSDALYALVRSDCIRIVNERLATTHRFIGDCARFYYLQKERREIECGRLVEWLQNPFWVQPIRWFALKLTLDGDCETWQELLHEALEGQHLQLLDLLLDGAILSKHPDSLFHEVSDDFLSFVIKRLMIRLLVIATESYQLHSDGAQSKSLRTRIAIQERVTGIPKADLWEPVWQWLLSQTSEAILDESCIVFKVAESWLNWSAYAQQFSLRSEVAEFTFNLAQKVLLPDPDPDARTLAPDEFAELMELRLKGEIPPPEPSQKKHYYLGDFESNVFSCIVFALRIIPERSMWFLRVLAGREIIPANKLEPTEISGFLSLPGVGVLEPPHPQGPSGKVNSAFRKFMLSQNGLYLNAVLITNPQLGVELFFALTIQPPRYLYEDDIYIDRNDFNYGTKGFNDIDICTFKFLPLLTLLEINEEIAINLVNTLCQIATKRNYEISENLHQRRHESQGNQQVDDLIDSLMSDTYELHLILENANKSFQGERKDLYWHRNSPLSPKIVNCLLMTLEGWLYSRPSRSELEKSIANIFNQSNTVAILGILVSLAKCDFSLLSKSLLPLSSSLQLLIWLEFEQIDQGQDYGFDVDNAWNLSKVERQELLNFHQLSYRKFDLQKIILNVWLNDDISSRIRSQIIENWDTYQFPLVSEVSQKRASKIRALFEPSNWKKERDDHGEEKFYFIGNVPTTTEDDAKTERAFLNLQRLQIVMTCRQILSREKEKTLLIHDQLENLLNSEEELETLKKNLDLKDFQTVIWASISVLLESPLKPLGQELSTDLIQASQNLINLPFSVDHYSRCQTYDLDSNAFITHVAPKLIRNLQTDKLILTAALRCLIGIRNRDTSVFIRRWIEEHGFEHSVTQRLISVIPFVARLISLTRGLAYAKCVLKATRPNGTHIAPRPGEIDYEVSKWEDAPVKAAWDKLQNDFIENKFQSVAIASAATWIPEALTQSIEETPNWLQERYIQHSFDWDFLIAALIPVLRMSAEQHVEFLNSLTEQILLTLLDERERLYLKDEAEKERAKKEKDIFSRRDTRVRLLKSQEKILDAIFCDSHQNLVKIERLLHCFNVLKILDCFILENIIDDLRYRIAYTDSVEKSTHSIKSDFAHRIGNHLLAFNEQTSPELRVFGDSIKVWEKLIELVIQESRNENNIVFLDDSLIQFFSSFRDFIFPHFSLRRELYRVAKKVKYKKFRRIIFSSIVQLPDLWPNYRNEQSQTLVEVLTELWDSDCEWIIGRQSRCESLKLLLGKLQEVDAVGARSLADQVVGFLSNFSNG